MSSVLDRLRRALAPAIIVERELASGGMGHVFVGRDIDLDRPIAIKVLRPELGTAIAAERFLREGRAAALLSDPHVVRVHHAGIADGLMYFTMDLVGGETLAARLLLGPLPADEAVAMGRDILAALVSAHRQHLVHRDVKPSNVFLDEGGAKLGDFGIARIVDPDAPTLTSTGQLIGTLAYMAPEQLRGEQATERTDVYAVGMVLFEACTGRRWPTLADPDAADWSEVPRGLRRSLRKALQLEPRERWADAARFAASLPGAGVEWLPIAVGTLVVAALVYLGVAAAHVPPGTGPERAMFSDLVIFPFEAVGVSDTALAREITSSTRWYFERLPHLRQRPAKAASRAWSASTVPPARRLAELTRRLGSRHGVWAVVRHRGDQLEVEATVVNQRGDPVLQTIVAGDSADRAALADQVGARIVAVVSSRAAGSLRRASAMARVPPEAVLEFVQGEEAFARDAWLTAERHYSRAVELDSTFLLAAWRLANARRWMPLRRDPPFPSNFLELFHARGDALPEVDRLLIEAQFAATGAPRFDRYEAANRAAPGDAYARLLYGDELFHRGPLAGHSLEEAATVLGEAVRADPTLAPAWEHLAWALIRLGRRDEAAAALDSLDGTAGRPEESEIFLPPFLRLAFTARFDPAAVARGAGPLLESHAALALAARGALAFDLPDFELAFGSRLAALEDGPGPLRGSGHVAQGAALVALGRPSAAFAHFDSAASLLADTAEARFQAAEWRVVPRALGIPGFGEEEADRGCRALEAFVGTARGTRALWALGLEALARQDSAAARSWQQALLEREGTDGPLGRSLAAATAAAQDPREALRLSEPALAYDSAGRAPDPFFRAALHLARGDWHASLGQAAEADRSWLWYESTDAVGWPDAEAQPADVDWALGTYARTRRALAAASLGDLETACPLARRVLQIWSSPDAPVGELAERLRRGASACGT